MESLEYKKRKNQTLETGDSPLRLIGLVAFLSFGLLSHEIRVAWIKSKTPPGCRYAASIWEKTPWHKLESLLELRVSMQGGWRGGEEAGKGRGSLVPPLGQKPLERRLSSSPSTPFCIPSFLPHSPSSFCAVFLPEMPSSVGSTPAPHTLPYQGLHPRNTLIYITWNSGEQMPSPRLISPLVTSLSSWPREAHLLLLLLRVTPTPTPTVLSLLDWVGFFMGALEAAHGPPSQSGVLRHLSVPRHSL